MNKKVLLLLAACCTGWAAMAQSISVRYKPGPVKGEDAPVFTSYGYTGTGRPGPEENYNSGTHSEMNYSQWTYNAGGFPVGTIRSMIRFTEMDTIPASAIILSAKLNLFGVPSSGNWGTSYFPGSPYPLSTEGWVSRITGPWAEMSVTWNTQPPCTAVNQAAIPPSGARFSWNTSIDVTDIIKDIRSSGTNDGMMLTLQTETYYRMVMFASSDHADASLWPELDIVYKSGSVTPPCAISFDYKTKGNNCFDYSFLGAATSAAGIAKYNWTFGPGNTDSIPQPGITFPGYGNYVVKLLVRDSSGCVDSMQRTVSIRKPVVNLVPADTTVCAPASLQLHAQGGVTYSWIPAFGLSSYSIADPMVNLDRDSGIYIVTVADSNGCIAMDTSIVRTLTPASVQLMFHDTIACPGAHVQLTALSPDADSLHWWPPTGLSAPDVANPVLFLAGNIDYVVTAYRRGGCSHSDTLRARQYPLPEVKAVAESYTLNCNVKSTRLHATGADSYSWTPASYCSDNLSADPLVIPPQSVVFTVEGKNSYGCSSFDTVGIVMGKGSLVYVPNAFSPNDDGLNDDIRPIVICNFTLAEFAVYNRWGQQVFNTSSLGQSWNGGDMDSGVYYYLLKGKDGAGTDVFLKGDITLLR